MLALPPAHNPHLDNEPLPTIRVEGIITNLELASRLTVPDQHPVPHVASGGTQPSEHDADTITGLESSLLVSEHVYEELCDIAVRCRLQSAVSASPLLMPCAAVGR